MKNVVVGSLLLVAIEETAEGRRNGGDHSGDGGSAMVEDNQGRKEKNNGYVSLPPPKKKNESPLELALMGRFGCACSRIWGTEGSSLEDFCREKPKSRLINRSLLTSLEMAADWIVAGCATEGIRRVVIIRHQVNLEETAVD